MLGGDVLGHWFVADRIVSMPIYLKKCSGESVGLFFRLSRLVCQTENEQDSACVKLRALRYFSVILQFWCVKRQQKFLRECIGQN